ncbi:ATP-dependent Clp protease ATP-binding subunit [Alkalicoccobacillus murimartini]|uniref:ATP-dependent Clp protease ATP-binding subunit ClpE n=1 Tax=Alkalicoccobacillus murimartini TaxID=171685 RepID=A0ABT9YE13_9BACI|nr:ATP-dependent Clp protease ATP-binding subunit [Alkalicoccobacillus murimartini]MDQ0206093.1 ATP-dependent Clp protease ATP-binding subunit ClpE [Alkalicoccobacillus murimartini]
MKCQHCQQNEAAVDVKLMINNQARDIHLCGECFQLMQQPLNNQGGSFDDLFKQYFSNQQGSNASSGVRQKVRKDKNAGDGFLDQYGSNLTAQAKNGQIDPVIGRADEVERVIQVLSRRTKNNPILIGEAGVGKTAIAEGLARRIAEGSVPFKMKDKQIYSLDLTSLVAGTSYRGQFEENIQKLIQEVEQREDVILFMDEIHMMVGAGASAEGSMDASNILKPALARGKFQLIGATTLKEFRQIEKDAALERRFQPVTVKEPTLEQTFEILQGLRPIYESYHHVAYSDEVLRASVALSDRYIQDRFLPDKAIDLLDEVGSRLSLSDENQDKEQIEERLTKIRAEKQQASEVEDYEKAALLRQEELVLLEQKEKAGGAALEVTVELLQDIIEKRTGIPVQKLQKAEQQKMKDLASRLEGQVIGQEEAVEKVAKAVKRSRAGLKAANRPISFMFIGPTGVGKTELSKTLAAEVFGSRDAMIRLDMSEFMEKHSVSKLIGSPPGYVGHDEGGQLTEQVRRKPYSIILLDEIEKAHPDVQHSFLQILEDGRLTDSQGRVVSFQDTIIIMTSNAGAGVQKAAVGFNGGQSKTLGMLEALNDYFKPEFLNRFDGLIEFNQLTQDHLVAIVDVMLDELRGRLDAQNIQMTVSDEAKRKLSELGYHPSFGARPLRRIIQETIEDEITEFIIDDESLQAVDVKVENEKLIVEKV